MLSAHPLKAQQTDQDLFAAITTQALQCRFLSRQVQGPTVLDSPLIRTPKYKHLVLFYYRLDRSTPIVSLTVSASVKLEAVPLPSSYHTSKAFTIDISALPESHSSHSQLSITPVRSNSGVVIHENKLTWRPSLGLRVIYAQSFPHLLTPAQTDLTLVYHRYDSEWSDWELHVWSKPQDGYPAVSAKLTPTRPVKPGQVVFHLVGYVFPYQAQVFVEPVRMALHPGHATTDEFGITVVGEPYRDACRRDVIRKWTSAQPPSQVIHLVQGDSRIYAHPPDPDTFNAQRRFRLRYRRFLPSDYEGWDLWTWDQTDPESHRIPLTPVAETRDWADFVVDRADYGSGKIISILPRRGGDAWLEQDEFVRQWSLSMLGSLDTSIVKHHEPLKQRADDHDDLPTFLITQETKLVLRHLDDARTMLDAYVDSDNSIVVSAPVPLQWLMPPQLTQSQPNEDMVIKIAQRPVQGLLDVGKEADDIEGKSLRFLKAKQVTPIKTGYVFDKSVAHFEEDFLVENVVVSVPGFVSVALHWETHENEDKYLYEGSLGWEYSSAKCIFRCFAPIASLVSVVLYDEPTGDAGRTVVPMRRIPQGCWKVTIIEDLKGRYYKLLAEGGNKRLFPGVEVIDPYSRCNTGHTGRGLVYGIDSTEVYPRPNVKPSAAIVYELHIRDITIDKCSGIRQRGKFLGLTERGTGLPNKVSKSESKALTQWPQERMRGVNDEFSLLDKFSTGLDHIVQMGVTAVQIMPIQDFDNDESDDGSYRWGYMPVHFNSPDGWYASSTHTVARVVEFKHLVSALHKAGLKVIMDVVYNHTAEDSNELNLDARFSFNGLAPRYYYRTCGNTPIAHTGDRTCGVREHPKPHCGECYSNGSGCGNEFRSESPMGRKFIIDSLKFWAMEYGVDGFRFDLLGLIDLETIHRAATELKSIHPHILVYGEPWIGGLSPIKITDKGSQRSKGFGVFNDTFRNAVRGSPFDTEETFIMDGGRLPEVKGGIIGSVDLFTDSPLESLNYVECHDNRTLWDHLTYYTRSRTDNIKFNEEDLRRMHRLAAVLVLTSQGVPFIQAGQEMCRTKFDDENSYESSDEINMIRWMTKLNEWSTVQYYRGLILLRRSHPEIFCLETADEIHKKVAFYEDCGLCVPERCIAYRIKGNPERLFRQLQEEEPDVDRDFHREESLRWSEVVVLLNATPLHVTFELPGRKTDTLWMQTVDSSAAGTRIIQGPHVGSVTVSGRSAAVLRRASPTEQEVGQLEMRLSSISDAYSSFHGDDPLTRYTVGLDPRPTVEDVSQRNDLISQRLEFDRRRSVNPSQATQDSDMITE